MNKTININICPKCGTHFEGKQGKRFCDNCAKKRKAEKQKEINKIRKEKVIAIKQCQYCFICFEVTVYSQSKHGNKYCSHACAGEAYGEARKQKAIQQAQTGFKVCTRCKIKKPLVEFNKNSRLASGYTSACGECRKTDWQSWINIGKNRKSVNLKKRIHRLTTEGREQEKKRLKLYKKRKNELESIKAATNPFFKLNRNMRSRINNSLRSNGSKNGRKWEGLVGYSTQELKKHLEKQFIPGMTWENYGEWHIDHIIPVSAFNFSKPEDIDFKRCWALKNLRPLWASDNISKNDRLDRHFQPSLQLAIGA